MSDSDELPIRPRDYLVLLSLADGERHGYGMVKEIEEITEGTVAIDPANLYRSLRRMSRDGWVEDAGKRPSPEGPDRRFYRLTGAGREVARREALRLRRLDAVARARDLVAEAAPR